MKNDSKALRNIVLISQLAICVMVPTFLCLALGIWLDKGLEHGLRFRCFLSGWQQVQEMHMFWQWTQYDRRSLRKIRHSRMKSTEGRGIQKEAGKRFQ